VFLSMSNWPFSPFTAVVVSMLVLEGLGRSLDPDLNLMKAAMPFLLGRGKV
jgi:predicted unusual protein kinase regulating ubiquinone biosynthesis (AarF/ABC1/UbiB family)